MQTIEKSGSFNPYKIVSVLSTMEFTKLYRRMNFGANNCNGKHKLPEPLLFGATIE